MKKKAFAILTLCISLFAAVALAGCGGSGGAAGSGGGGGAEKPAVDMRTDFIWFKVEVPEGVEITDVAGDTADRAQFKFTESEHASDRFIPVFDSDKNADELFDYEAKWKANSGWTENDPVKYNGKTWRSAYFTHSGGVTTEYFTDVEGGSVYVRIDNVEEHKDAVEAMMKSLEFADDIVFGLRAMMKAVSAPDTMPGLISGMMTFQKACIQVQPRSIAASTRLRSICRSLGPTDKIT